MKNSNGSRQDGHMLRKVVKASAGRQGQTCQQIHERIGLVGKIFTGTHRFSIDFPIQYIWGFPVIFPVNQPIEYSN